MCLGVWGYGGMYVIIELSFPLPGYILLIWRSKHGWFDEREACTKKIERRWFHAPQPTISQNPGGPGGGGSHTRTGPGRPPGGGVIWQTRPTRPNHTTTQNQKKFLGKMKFRRVSQKRQVHFKFANFLLPSYPAPAPPPLSVGRTPSTTWACALIGMCKRHRNHHWTSLAPFL